MTPSEARAVLGAARGDACRSLMKASQAILNALARIQAFEIGVDDRLAISEELSKASVALEDARLDWAYVEYELEGVMDRADIAFRTGQTLKEKEEAE